MLKIICSSARAKWPTPDAKGWTNPAEAPLPQQEFHGPFDVEALKAQDSTPAACFAQWLSHNTHPGEPYQVHGPLDELEVCGATAVDGKLFFASAHDGEPAHLAQATKLGKVIAP